MPLLFAYDTFSHGPVHLHKNQYDKTFSIRHGSTAVWLKLFLASHAANVFQVTAEIISENEKHKLDF